jgi:Putative MetA-pathway of phenol degradation
MTMIKRVYSRTRCHEMARCIEFVLVVASLSGCAATASPQPPPSPPPSEARQSLADAWWTGPMLAPSAATLPRGHMLIEPYFYDVIGSHSNGLGSLTYMNYGLANKLTVGLIPTAGYNKVSNGPSSSGVAIGDLTVQTQYRLTAFSEGRRLPTSSIAVQETLPTARYDQLGTRLSDGLGAGAYTTTLGLYSQTYFWLPNRRILRMRFNVTQSFSSNVKVKDVSVYGTQTGFLGKARPGDSSFADLSGEYSLTRKWVLALEATYRHSANTRVTGYDALSTSLIQIRAGIQLNPGSVDTFAFAPAIEYSWRPNLGLLLGMRVIPSSHNTNSTITPALAINFVH